MLYCQCLDLYPTDPLFHELEIMKINHVFKLQVAKFIFNCMHLNTPHIFHNWFTLNHMVHNYKSRSTFFDIDNGFKSNNLCGYCLNYSLWIDIIISIWPKFYGILFHVKLEACNPGIP